VRDKRYNIWNAPSIVPAWSKHNTCQLLLVSLLSTGLKLCYPGKQAFKSLSLIYKQGIAIVFQIEF
jgi:hypothetical protein